MSEVSSEGARKMFQFLHSQDVDPSYLRLRSTQLFVQLILACTFRKTNKQKAITDLQEC